jgi:hypothetical protein
VITITGVDGTMGESKVTEISFKVEQRSSVVTLSFSYARIRRNVEDTIFYVHNIQVGCWISELVAEGILGRTMVHGAWVLGRVDHTVTGIVAITRSTSSSTFITNHSNHHVHVLLHVLHFKTIYLNSKLASIFDRFSK